ncbi:MULTISPECIES: amphi-Trp domain-containing protein [unclassified Streptomyces]|uniref:amphi-Trp domain-containing protein n=1 Tax=unclassified Streptomyces TaxID=2593676 RepID=UPI0023664505|nr:MULTISPECIES: amphi-Trp domain-containing protein [unclassified Streptomyces]WDF39530.1 amphi-Trp domain-containing protein [Streptomyces sp. T12]
MSSSAISTKMVFICLFPRWIGDAMQDLKLEQKRSLSRLEAADQLEALATALREGGDAELELDPWKLSLRIPDDLRGEIEVEVSDGEIELEIEFKWPTAPGAEKAGSGRKSTAAAPGRARTGGGRTSKRTAATKS